jgi:Zn-dependent protease
MKSSWTIGSVSGIRISVHWTFWILIVWIISSNLRAGAQSSAVIWSVLFIFSIFACVVLHELGHAMAAKRFRIRTLDITLYPIGGVARLAAIPRKPSEELQVALAGPAVNLILAAIFAPWIDWSHLNDGSLETESIGARTFLFNFVVVNLWLALFNLIPAFPMDGGRVFRALLSFRMNRAKATRIAAGVGQALAIVCILLGFYVNPFLLFIGIFVFIGAQAESQFTQTEELIRGHTVRELTMTTDTTLAVHTTIGEAASEMLRGQRRNFVISEHEQVLGTLEQLQVIRGLREHGDQAHVDTVMDRNPLTLLPDMPVDEALRMMQQEKKSVALVMDRGTLLGMVDSDNLAEFVLILNARQAYADHRRGD